MTADATTNDEVSRLTRHQTWNIGCLIMAFSCVVAFLTLIVGTGAVVIKSVGGDTSLAPFPLGVFFLGMGLISLAATHWIFELWGRKYGLWTGCGIALGGVVIAIFGCLESSPALILLANVFLGAGAGISMYVRFAAVEVVPPEYSSRAVSWVLCGGCLAAFAGPEAAQATRGVFGDDHLTYLGVFVVAAGFVVAQAIFVGLVTFQSSEPGKKAEEKQEAAVENSAAPNGSQEKIHKEDTCLVVEDGKPENYTQEGGGDVEQPKTTPPRPNQDSIMSTPDQLVQIIRHPNFYIPMILSALAWAIM
jgi:MFS family permease